MKLTKTAVALAVASFVAMPMAASATTTLSGLVQIKIGAADEDVDGTADDESDPKIAAGDVLFGITTDHTMNNGLTGYGSMRADFNSLSNEGAAQADSAYVGMKGGFGDLRFGEIPLAVEYGQLSNDIYDVGGEINGGMSYTGGFGPASVILNYSPGRNSDAVGAGIKFNAGGFTIGLGAEERNELANAAAGVSFSYAGASIGIHGATLEQGGGVDDTEIFGVKVGYGVGNLSLAVTHMTQSSQTAVAADATATPPVLASVADSDVDTTRFDIVYDLGGDTEVSSRINSYGGDADGSDWRIQLTKFF
ncbi:MAG: porin [Granulosicoccaceae bacterium]